jgi:beta-mannosidase
VFEHHRNTFEHWAVRDGIYRHYTGEKELTLEEYCLYGGLFQGALLAYEADQMRAQADCNGCVLWCLTDGFGEVGFSLLDRFGNPKPAYYFLRRAYGAERLVLRRSELGVQVLCSNDTAEDRVYRLECGYVTFGGEYAPAKEIEVEIPAFTKRHLAAELPLEGMDLEKGAFYVRGEGLLPVTLRTADFRQLQLPRAAKLTVSDVKRIGESLQFRVSTDVFAHAVHFGLAAERLFSDQYFDLLPGESRVVILRNAQGLTEADIQPRSIFVG